MQYLLLIYTAADSGEPQPGDPEFGPFCQSYFDFSAEVSEAGVMDGGNALQPVHTATTVRVRDGKTGVTDGPFAETKEILGGYYLLNCEDLDEAIAYAAKIPSARFGSIEIRPILDVTQLAS